MSLDSFKQDNANGLDFGLKVNNVEDLIDLSEFERYNINELEEDIELQGKPLITYFERDDEDKTYESLRLQIINEKEKEVINCYCSIPLGYPVIKGIRRGNNFYKSTYNLILGTFNADKDLDDTLFYDNEGNPMNNIKEINLGALVNYINKKKTMKIRVVENGNYNSFVVLGLE